ncbi:MAG: hypothetical protein FWB85_03095 [Chitinispirillia bacterium]|nr:hypothetical protein [Chitinispirillia bacterium]MCL2241373.1 hypothetical protein [Chitinispirillia bacterium]
MATARRFAGIGTAFLFTFALVAATFGPVNAQTDGTMQYCEVQFTGCPQDYDEKELVVPLEVVALSTRIQACGISAEVPSDAGDPPAIMFVIDHSGSMRSGNNSGNDPNGNRFRVTRALVDTIYKAAPKAQVGVAIFAAGLVHQTSWDQNLIPFAPSPSDGAYLPLRALDAPAQAGGYASGSGATWYDVVTGMFNVPAAVNTRSTLLNGDRQTVAEQSNTNITIAFEAALQEFQKINAANGIVRKNQYIIFLSDGEPQVPNNSSWNSKLNHFRDSTANTPTTYTVFLTNNNSNPPVQLNTMTTNIQNNGYSESNPNSAIWAISADYSGLLTLMMENIVSQIVNKAEGNAKNITISSAGVRDSTGAMTGGEFTFSRRLPIDTLETTPVTMGVRYDVKIDSIFTNQATGQPDTLSRIARDSLFTYNVSIRRTASPGTNWKETQGLSTSCGTKPTLSLLFRADTLSSTVNGGTVRQEAKGNMDTLTVVFNNSGGLFDYKTVIVEVKNTDGTITDLENLTMTKNGDIWIIRFQRVDATVAGVANPGDRRLQHAAQDSIVVVFRNPDIPLDTLRIAVPYISTTMAFYGSDGNPSGKTQLPDEITIKAGDVQDIFAKFFDADGHWDQAMENDPKKITWDVSGAANATLTGEGHHGVFRSETVGLYSVTATYKDGPLVITRTIHIKVEPGPPEYLEVIRDTTKIAAKADTTKLKQNTEFEFDDKAVDRVIFYVLERDKYGNLIGYSVGAVWTSNNQTIEANGRGDGSSAEVIRRGSSFADGLQVIVRNKDGLEAKIDIRVVGDGAVAIGPNPFVPGKNDVAARLQALDQQNGSKTYDYYKDIIERTGTHGPGNSKGSRTGVLIAATSQRSIQVSGNGTPAATVMIYDAVGNVVYRSKPGDITLAEDKVTFGFIWDGKNNSGRTVGPGTYLVKMVGTQTNGLKFSESRKIGVTVEGKTR